MADLFDRRLAVWGLVLGGVGLIISSINPEIPRFAGMVLFAAGAVLAILPSFFAWRKEKRPTSPDPSPQSTPSDALFDFENSDVEMEDTVTEGDRKQVNAKGGRFKSTRWETRDKP